jgi:hypothetical protein
VLVAVDLVVIAVGEVVVETGEVLRVESRAVWGLRVGEAGAGLTRLVARRVAAFELQGHLSCLTRQRSRALLSVMQAGPMVAVAVAVAVAMVVVVAVAVVAVVAPPRQMLL